MSEASDPFDELEIDADRREKTIRRELVKGADRPAASSETLRRAAERIAAAAECDTADRLLLSNLSARTRLKGATRDRLQGALLRAAGVVAQRQTLAWLAEQEVAMSNRTGSRIAELRSLNAKRRAIRDRVVQSDREKWAAERSTIDWSGASRPARALSQKPASRAQRAWRQRRNAM